MHTRAARKAQRAPRLSLIAATLIVTLVSGVGVTLWQDRVAALDEGQRTARNLVQVLEEQTTRSIQVVDFTLLGMIDVLQLSPAMPVHDRHFENTLREKLAMLPYVRALFVIGADGFITQDSDHPTTPHVSLADRDYFITHARDPDLGLYIGPPLVSRSAGVWFVSLSRRLDRPDGSFGGIAVAAIEPRYFEHFYQTLRLKENDTVALFARDAILITRHPYREDLVGKNFAHFELFQRDLPKEPTGTYRNTSFIDGVGRIVSYRSLPDLPLLVVVGLAEEAVLAGWRRNAVTTILTTLAVVALILVVSRLALRWHQDVLGLNKSLLQQNQEILAREAEKEVLLREIHHRVKNNLQAMWGMIQFERSRLKDPEARIRLALVGDRISLLGRIHEQLYTSGNFADVNMAEHIDELCRNLAEASGRLEGLTLQVEAEPLLLSLEVALPVGLMVNEIVSNALKHAFPDGRPGHIRVTLYRQAAEQVVLSVSDNGVGRNGSEPDHVGIGLTLVEALARQIEGTLSYSADAGYCVVVSFPDGRRRADS